MPNWCWSIIWFLVGNVLMYFFISYIVLCNGNVFTRRKRWDDDKLKPCPFCGKPGHINNTSGALFWVECEDYRYCGASTLNSSTEEIAIEIWNRRASDEKKK